MRSGCLVHALLGFSIAVAGSTASATDYPYAKGYCFFGDSRIVMNHTQDGSGWLADLGSALSAGVSFEPGYGMTFVTLTVQKQGKSVSKSTMMIPGDIKADSTQASSSSTDMSVYDALSSGTLVDGNQVCCEYNFFVERTFEGSLPLQCM